MVNEKLHSLYVIGAGPGVEELLTPQAQRLIKESRFVAGGRRLLNLAPPDAEKFAIGADLEEARKFIEPRLAMSDVSVLASGDPGCYSIMTFLKSHFGEKVKAVPGISSVQLLAARLAVPWQDWRLVSLHGRDGLEQVRTEPRPVLFFCDGRTPPQAVASQLLKKNADRCFAAPAAQRRLGRVVIGTSLGGADEQLWQGTLAEAAAGDFPGHSLLLLLPAGPGDAARAPAPPAQAAAPGIPDHLWARKEGVPMSKSEVRAVLLAKAQPALRRVIWDVGAGTGSYAVECSLLAPGARVIAIDKNRDACVLIKENAARFGADLETVCAAAPACFAGLPRPDLVIIGGHAGSLAEIFASAITIISPGGRIAVTAVLADTKKTAHQLFAASGLKERQATRVAIARGEGHAWVESNPVILFTGDRE